MRIGCKWNIVTNTLAYCSTVLICISVKEQVELGKFTSAPAILSQKLRQEIHIFGKGEGERREREGEGERGATDMRMKDTGATTFTMMTLCLTTKLRHPVKHF